MRRQVVAVTVLATLVACDSSAPTRPDPSPIVTGITVTGDEKFTEFNQIHALTATAQMNNAPPRDITAEAAWQSNDPTVVAVSSSGAVRSVGFGSATVTASYQDQQGSLEVRVVPEGPAWAILGNYRLAFTAAASCRGLPDWARHREYGAVIGVWVDGSLYLAVELSPGHSPQVELALQGTRVEIDFPTDMPHDYYGHDDPLISEPISGTSLFAVKGRAKGTVRNTNTIAGTLDGTIRAVNPAKGSFVQCARADHKFSLVRR